MSQPETIFYDSCIEPCFKFMHLFATNLHGNLYSSGLPDKQIRTRRGFPLLLEVELKFSHFPIRSLQACCAKMRKSSAQYANINKFSAWGHNVYLIIGIGENPNNPDEIIVLNPTAIIAGSIETARSEIPQNLKFTKPGAALQFMLKDAKQNIERRLK